MCPYHISISASECDVLCNLRLGPHSVVFIVCGSTMTPTKPRNACLRIYPYIAFGHFFGNTIFRTSPAFVWALYGRVVSLSQLAYVWKDGVFGLFLGLP